MLPMEKRMKQLDVYSLLSSIEQRQSCSNISTNNESHIRTIQYSFAICDQQSNAAHVSDSISFDIELNAIYVYYDILPLRLKISDVIDQCKYVLYSNVFKSIEQDNV
jgi:hypothetical protein